MAQGFDPYHKWLAIPPEDQPPNHYRLLGLKLFEEDLDVVESAADKCMAHLRSFQTGKNAKVAQKLLNEVSAARVCLLNQQQRAGYDEELRKQMADPLPSLDAISDDIFGAEMTQPLASPTNPISTFGSPQPAQSMSNRVKRTPEWALPFAIVGAIAMLLVGGVVLVYLVGGHRDEVASTDSGRVDGKSSSQNSLRNNPNHENTDQIGSKPRSNSIKPSDGWIELLVRVDLENDLVHGEWERTPAQELKVVQHKPYRHELFSLPAEIDGSYELEIDFTREGGLKNSLAVVLPIEKTHARVSIDGWPQNGGLSGIDHIDGKPADELPNPNREFRITNGVRHTALIKVDQQNKHVTIIALVDDTKVVEYSGPVTALSVPGFLGGNQKRLPVIGTWGSEFRIHSVRLRLFDGAANLIR